MLKIQPYIDTKNKQKNLKKNYKIIIKCSLRRCKNMKLDTKN